jgi:transcription antitermination protein NusB
MGARRMARERAVQALYQLDMSGGEPIDALASAWAAEEAERPDPQAVAFAEELVRGVTGRKSELDALIETHSHNWRISRMGRIDRSILRLGTFELLHRQDIPRKVTLNEAIELAKTFGAEGSSSFINGLLDRIAVALDKK